MQRNVGQLEEHRFCTESSERGATRRFPLSRATEIGFLPTLLNERQGSMCVVPRTEGPGFR